MTIASGQSESRRYIGSRLILLPTCDLTDTSFVTPDRYIVGEGGITPRPTVVNREPKMSTREVVQLIRKMRNPHDKSATQAVAELRAHGWLIDGTLERSSLQHVHLQGVDLTNANLQKVDLSHADLQGADLSLVNLQDARLRQTNLYKADLSKANLKNADLSRANLNRARNISNEQLAQAHRLMGATMPGGDLYDGRFNLEGDTEFARTGGVDTEDKAKMAAFYGVSVQEYERGQQWRRDHRQGTQAA